MMENIAQDHKSMGGRNLHWLTTKTSIIDASLGNRYIHRPRDIGPGKPHFRFLPPPFFPPRLAPQLENVVVSRRSAMFHFRERQTPSLASSEATMGMTYERHPESRIPQTTQDLLAIRARYTQTLPFLSPPLRTPHVAELS